MIWRKTAIWHRPEKQPDLRIVIEYLTVCVATRFNVLRMYLSAKMACVGTRDVCMKCAANFLTQLVFIDFAQTFVAVRDA